MTITPSAVLQAISNISDAEFLPSTPRIEAIQARNGQDMPVTLSPVDTDNYQIALIPPRSGQWNRNAPRDSRLNGLLLLPLTWKELVTRVHREIDRPHAARPQEIAHFGQVRINLLSMEVARADRLVKLSALEFKVLRFFLFNQNRVISRDELLNEVWGYENYPCTRTVDNHILKLRQKLEPDPAHPVHFRTSHGMGYRFVP